MKETACFDRLLNLTTYLATSSYYASSNTCREEYGGDTGSLVDSFEDRLIVLTRTCDRPDCVN